MKLLLCIITTFNIFAVSVGEVIFTKGDVSVEVGNKKNTRKINKGHKLQLNEIVVTGKKSLAVIKLKDKSTLKVDKNSKMRVSSILKKLTPTKVEISKGAVFFNIIKKKAVGKKNPVSFKVQTRTAAMGVRGTTFFVSASGKDKNYDTWMCVKEGIVEAKRHKSTKAVLVKTGEGVKLSRTEKVDNPRPLPWTQGLNWEFNTQKNIENKVDISNAYKDILDQDYD
ncbi:MAG: hypothetical protein BM556_17760 [Bacteriovorax sp. MedPE-SWde]|nr:MAG: hypothetical protein BM556_17760 [Bacteriovorax sp. MedPE-SWde]